MTQEINKDLNIVLRFSDIVTPSIFKNNLGMILSSKPKLFEDSEAQQEIRYSFKKKRIWNDGGGTLQ